MKKVKILFFAADPLSIDGREPRLLLDEDVREIRAKVRAAEHRDALEFDYRFAARPDDLLQGLSETRPQVVHFSGHGGSRGLVLMHPREPRAHHVDGPALAQLFRAFPEGIRLVVLNACFSLPQAQAIAEVVGCTIGTSGAISDEAAITFGSQLYAAIACGKSVKTAFERASAALALSHPDERDCARLVTRRGVNPRRIVLVPRRWGRRLAIGGTALAGAALAAAVYLPHASQPGAPSARDPAPAGNPGRVVQALPLVPETARTVPPPAPATAAPIDSVYRPPAVDDSGNLVQNGGFQSRWANWTRSVDGTRGKGTNEIVSFADARSGYALHLAYEGEGNLTFAQKIPVSGPDFVFRGTFRATAHEGPMIGFSGTGIATVMVQYLDADGQFLGTTSFYSYVANPLAGTPLVGVPRRGNGGNTVHYIDMEKDRLYKDYELDIRREIEEHLVGVVPDQVRTIAIVLFCGATDDGAGAELWVSDLSLRPKR